MGKQKYKIVSQLLDETMQEISQSEENWCKFLTTSSRLYKYPFEEQVLIFAQRPDATALRMKQQDSYLKIWQN